MEEMWEKNTKQFSYKHEIITCQDRNACAVTNASKTLFVDLSTQHKVFEFMRYGHDDFSVVEYIGEGDLHFDICRLNILKSNRSLHYD